MKVQANYTLEQMQTAIKQKKTFYQFFKIRRPWRDYTTTKQTAYCPICRKTVNLVIIGWLNNRYTKENWLRCENCLLKLPSLMAKKLERIQSKIKGQDNRITNFLKT